MSTSISRERLRPGPAGDTSAAAEFRTDIQALRAVAVAAVVLNHLWPTRLTGGYVGVDVFFVISGFLISSHLGREIAATGRLQLGRFYARRVRRLLPAALFVIAVSIVAAYVFLPFPQWASNAGEFVASACYAENWLLAAKSVDYSALTASASITQHYWSLSVEEQFYLVWPLLLLLLFKVRKTPALVAGISVVGALSLAFSAYFTAVSKSQAYFVTPVRVWEFAIGALIALAGRKFVLPAVMSGLVSLAGLVMIFGSAVVFDHQTAFPGVAALIPAVGTGLVIIAGNRPGRHWHAAVSCSPPVQWLGNVSYSLYLWHWPLIVLVPFVLHDTPNLGQRIGVLAVALVLAHLSKVLIEDRGRSWARLVASTKITFVAMTAGLVVIAVMSAGLVWSYDRHVTQAAAEVRNEAIQPCHGAAAMVPGNSCPDPYGPAKVVDMGPANDYWTSPSDCGAQLNQFMVGDRKTTRICDFSGGAPSPKVVWLVGDSHAEQWEPPLVDLAREQKWVLKLSYLGGCPFAKVQFLGYDGDRAVSDAQPCMNWTSTMADAIAGDHPAYVFTSFFARHEQIDDKTGHTQDEQYRDGLLPLWNSWTAASARVVVLADPPLNGDVRQPDCVTLNPTDPTRCAVERSRAQPPDPLLDAAQHSGNPMVEDVDLTKYFCDATRCYAVIGDVVVYFDDNHLNREFSRSLRPMIAAAVGVSDR